MNAERTASRAAWAASASIASSALLSRSRVSSRVSVRPPSGGASSATAAARAASAAEAPLVLSRVEAQSALGPLRLEQPVASLPRPQQLGRDARPAAQLADPQPV